MQSPIQNKKNSSVMNQVMSSMQLSVTFWFIRAAREEFRSDQGARGEEALKQQGRSGAGQNQRASAPSILQNLGQDLQIHPP